MNKSFLVRPAEEKDWDSAMEMTFKTFMKYEGVEYGPEGTKHFAEFVTDPILKKMFLKGEYKLYVAEYDKEIIGVISLRSGNHISLLFVAEKFHRQGVGTALMQHLFETMRKEAVFAKVTVNAAPYGIPFYHRIGFTDIGPKTKQDGITYVPMEYQLHMKKNNF